MINGKYIGEGCREVALLGTSHKARARPEPGTFEDMKLGGKVYQFANSPSFARARGFSDENSGLECEDWQGVQRTTVAHRSSYLGYLSVLEFLLSVLEFFLSVLHISQAIIDIVEQIYKLCPVEYI